MIELTKINLLPYREEILQKKKKQFNMLMLLALLIGIGLAGITFLTISNMIGSQEARNALLESKITELDTDLGEIKKLQQEKTDFLSKKKKVEELQEKRFQAASIIDSFNVLIPESTYITSVVADSPTSYTISGRAISDSKIAQFMRSLPSNGIFAQPELVSIKKVDNYQEFTLKVLLAGQAASAPQPTAAAQLQGK